MYKATTQRMLQLAIMLISIRYRSDCMFDQPRIKGTIFMDTMTGQYKSIDGNRYAQVLSNDYFFAAVYPMDKRV